MRESGGKQIRVRPSFHEELERLGRHLDLARGEMVEVLRGVETESKVETSRVTCHGMYAV